MGSLDMDTGVCALLSRLHTTDCDSVISEVQAAADAMLIASQHQQQQPSCSVHRLPGRPLLSSAVSLPDASFYSQSSFDIASPEPRFNSDPGRLEDILSAYQSNQPAISARRGTLHQTFKCRMPVVPDRRTVSLGDVYAIAASLQSQQPASAGSRKLSDASSVAAGWDSGIGLASESMQSSQRYKTELCRPFEEHGTCRYGSKCQFAHGRAELRTVARHPKYKTEMCRTFHTTGYCPYGPRCHFIHNDDVVIPDQLPAQQQLSRQSSTSGAATGTVEQATAAQRDLERRRSQLMQLHLHSKRMRATIDEIPDEGNSAADWFPPAAERRQSCYGTAAPSAAWIPPTSVCSSSPSVSPIPSSSVTDILQYVVDPPPGIPIPPAVDALLAAGISPSRSTAGNSPTSDLTPSVAGISNLETPSAGSMIYHQLVVASQAANVSSSTINRSSSGRPLLSASSFPTSFFADNRVTSSTSVPISSVLECHTGADMAAILATSAHMQTVGEPASSITSQQRLLSDRVISPCGSADAWLSSSVSDRGVAYSSGSCWAAPSQKHSYDDSSSSGSSFNDDDDDADLRQKMASLSPKELAALIDIIKLCSPATTACGMTADVTSQPMQTNNTWKFGRSLSIADPSAMTSRRVDGLPWAQRTAMTPSPNLILAANRAAGVYG